MSILRLKYVDTYYDRHGRLRRYFRRPGHGRIPLTGEPGSPEFNASYQEAWAATDCPSLMVAPENAPRRIKPGSIAALVASYYKSPAYTSLSLSTRQLYKGIIDRFRLEHGDDAVAGLRAKHVKAIIQKRGALGTPDAAPFAANSLLQCIRLLMRHAVELEWRHDDPTFGIRKVRTSDTGGFRTWTEDDIAKFEEKWPIGTRERLAMALALYTGQRRSDIIGMGRQHVSEGAIFVRQRKTGAALSIPLHPELKKVLAEIPKGQLTFLVTKHGKSYSAAGFTNWFQKAVEDARLPAGSSVHGLRKAAARRLAEAGATAHEIAAITGHRTLAEVQRYTLAADQKRLAQAAIKTLQRRPRVQPPRERRFPNRASRLGNAGK